MMFITHISLGLLLGLVLLKLLALPVEPMLFLMAITLGSLFPDIDSATSFIGSKFKPVSLFFKHRGAIHSFPIMMACATIFFAISGNVYYSLAFFLGYFFHLLLDSLTPKGVLWFWPGKKRIRGKIRTTGTVDFLVLFMFLAADIVLVLYL